MVEWGVGQHHPEVFQSRGYLLYYRSVFLPFQQYNRTAGGSQQFGFLISNMAVLPGFIQGSYHYRQGFGRAVFPPA